MQVAKYFSLPTVKKILILCAVAVFALQSLYFIYLFSVNVPRAEEWYFLPLVLSVHDGKPFWEYNLLFQLNDQRPIFPSLIVIVNTALTSWNVVYEAYIGWGLLVISTYVVYLILKRTDTRLDWLIIPIAAFMFNTEQYQNLLWSFPSNSWFLTLSGITLTIYFTNKVEEKKIAIIPAILFASIASFSTSIGLLTWIVGSLSLFTLSTMRKRSLSIWIISTIIIFVLYFINFDFHTEKAQIHFSTFFTQSSLEYILTYLSNGMIAHFSIFDKIRTIVGIVIISLIMVGTVYLKLNKVKIKEIMPWLQLGITGLLAAIVVDLGRLGVDDPLNSRYTTIAGLSQISALVFAVIIFVHLRNIADKRKKMIISAIFVILIVSIVISLSTAYYAGWLGGSLMFKEMSTALECITNPYSNFVCVSLAPDARTLPDDVKLLRERNLGPFADQVNLKVFSENPLLKDDAWKNMIRNSDGVGSIEFIDMKPTNNEEIFTDKTKVLIPIKGWGILTKNGGVDEVYVFIDNKVNSKADYGYVHRITKVYDEEESYFTEWRGVIDLHELSSECHNVSVRLVKENYFYEIISDSKLCMN